MLMKSLVCAAVLGVGVAGFSGAASAGPFRCSPGWWRGPTTGPCQPMSATDRSCPVGYHLGRKGLRCWPNYR